MYSRVSVTFTVTGVSLESDRITAHVGLTPTRTWRRGDPFGRAGQRRQHAGWSLASDLPDSAEPEAHAERVLTLLRPVLPRAAEVVAPHDAELECVVRSYGGAQPAVHLEPSIVSELATLGAAIDIDLLLFP